MLFAKKAYHFITEKSRSEMLVKSTPGVNFINFFARIFFAQTRCKALFGKLQTAHRFGEFSIDFSLKFRESIVGEIEL